ncbi:hypothetical protein CDL15_Pgr011405 [Punica granatum]|uniref:E3 ubiquitin-protein ligase MIEL1 n=1 Tax=Punica granatum TaxID=22663 RepID=A0A218WFL7_PUNGR|nr:hypothetical protein CDL15_Pgr011405 [Punica granatum]
MGWRRFIWKRKPKETKRKKSIPSPTGSGKLAFPLLLPSPSPDLSGQLYPILHLHALLCNSWKPLQMNALASGRWATGASIIGGGARFELHAATTSSSVAIAITRLLEHALSSADTVVDESNMLSKIYDRHELDRHDVKQVVCAVCDTEQPVAQVCTNCGVNMGEYFCEICKFFDDDTEKGQFHCDDCGICRVGGRENFFHCKKCGSCYSIGLRNNHSCVENSMRHHCPICYEYLFDSMKDTIVMKCGHTMHCDCYNEMLKRDKYCCPICSKSVIDMSRTWKRMDEEIEATVMPEDYRDRKVWILCNDCNDTTEVYFHIIGQKCSHCKSYNTRSIAPPVLPQ